MRTWSSKATTRASSIPRRRIFLRKTEAAFFSKPIRSVMDALQSHSQGQLCMALKVANTSGRMLVVEQVEVGLRQIGSLTPMSIAHREDQVHLIHAAIHGERSQHFRTWRR